MKTQITELHQLSDEILRMLAKLEFFNVKRHIRIAMLELIKEDITARINWQQKQLEHENAEQNQPKESAALLSENKNNKNKNNK